MTIDSIISKGANLSKIETRDEPTIQSVDNIAQVDNVTEPMINDDLISIMPSGGTLPVTRSEELSLVAPSSGTLNVTPSEMSIVAPSGGTLTMTQSEELSIMAPSGGILPVASPSSGTPSLAASEELWSVASLAESDIISSSDMCFVVPPEALETLAQPTDQLLTSLEESPFVPTGGAGVVHELGNDICMMIYQRFVFRQTTIFICSSLWQTCFLH